MPFEVGNQLRARQMAVESTLRRVIAQDKADRLRRAVERLFDDAADGETWQQRHAALAWIADRTDGKAISRSESTDGDVRTLTLQDVARLIYQARASDSVDASPASPSTESDVCQAPGDPQAPATAETTGGGTVGGPLPDSATKIGDLGA